ncbi:MAG: LVIVD repeat-containing protein [Conexibacter sp.]
MDVFDLTLRQTRQYAAMKNFEVVGHSYLKGPWLDDFARRNGMGAGFNTVRVYDGIAYLAGYNSPRTLFGVLLADVHDPKNIKPLSFIPANIGTRTAYLRVDPKRHLLVFGNDSGSFNPRQPPPGEAARGGISVYDVSNPRQPKELSFLLTRPNGATHGLDIDDRYVYGCANTSESKADIAYGSHELSIIDIGDPRDPKVVGRLHLPGQHIGESFPERDQQNPDGTPQVVWCHEIVVDGNYVYVSWRDAGMVIVDASDKANPKVVAQLDYVPPFNGGSLGAAHSSVPVPTQDGRRPTLLIQTDEIFQCPPGFGRIVDISALSNPQVVSSFRIPAVDDNYDFKTGRFTCPPGQQSIHLPWFDYRTPSLMYVTWYDQGLRAWDISNPFVPREVGYYLSPQYAVPEPPSYPADRQTREVYQDPATGLIYVTDGNGGGLTVLKWTGPVPAHPPIPAAR